jgi:hypothetical protein
MKTPEKDPMGPSYCCEWEIQTNADYVPFHFDREGADTAGVRFLHLSIMEVYFIFMKGAEHKTSAHHSFRQGTPLMGTTVFHGFNRTVRQVKNR